MITRRLNETDDWTFGQSKANFLNENAAILQNVKTRLRSFQNDWFLDIGVGINWFYILGIKENKQLINDEVKRVCLGTNGVTRLNNIAVLQNDTRVATIIIDLDTIFAVNNKMEIKV